MAKVQKLSVTMVFVVGLMVAQVSYALAYDFHLEGDDHWGLHHDIYLTVLDSSRGSKPPYADVLIYVNRSDGESYSRDGRFTRINGIKNWMHIDKYGNVSRADDSYDLLYCLNVLVGKKYF